jgi:drug/metabolite transporter (DMT)-like permease
LGGVILQLVAALLGLALLAFQYYQGAYATPRKIIATSQGDSERPYSPNITSDVADSLWAYDRPGILWSIGAGLAVGIAEMVSFFVSSMGVPAVHSIPVIIGGSVLFGTVLGFVLLGENLSPRGWCGVLMLVAGIGLVGSDG